jgi:YVTN family beta-propeller protein
MIGTKTKTVPMNVRRVAGLVGMTLPILVWMACGQVYRPVVIPCSTGGVPGCPVETNPKPSNFHAVFGITTNSPNYPGGAMQIDVSGDSILAETPTSNPSQPNLGELPTHAVIANSDARVFVAAAGSVLAGGVDVVSSFTPVFQSSLASGFGIVNTINLPSLSGQSASIGAISEAGNLVTATLASPLLASPASSNLVAVGTSIVIAGVVIPNCSITAVPSCNANAYNGTFSITAISPTTVQFVNPTAGLAAASGGMASIPGQPVYLASTETTALYAANFNSNSVTKINTLTNVVTNMAAVGVNPVSMAEIPNGMKLYVANQGDNTVSSLNTVDLSPNVVTGFTGKAPVWVVARGDGQKVYVLTQGDGQLVTIDEATDSVTSSLSVGAGANFIFFDPNLNRLYVTNPVTQMLYVFSDTGGVSNGIVSDIPAQIGVIPFTAGSVACPQGCVPVTVTALADGSRFYVASYQSASACPDVTGACIIPGLTVFSANSLAEQYPNAPTLTLLSQTSTQFVVGQTGVPVAASCASAPGSLYTPGSTRFRLFTAASVDSTRVYVAMCDAGAVAVINTTDSNTNNSGGAVAPDSLVIDLLAAYSAAVQSSGQPAPQNPTFLFTGQ